jgi:hypothetical protein
VSRKSHSLPIALSLPLIIPHSKSFQGPSFSIPTSSSVRFAAANAMLYTVSIVILWRRFGCCLVVREQFLSH